ncbi:DsbA family protein [Shewanella mangrovisoli]|uniref:DsbA family protein n=1 Tax=Shewanella mangrovisoli TaxID=2864211 RepID=UPI000143F082
MNTTENPPAVLHAIIDPLCGWCYAAAPLFDAAAAAGFTIKLHAGGMLTGPRRKQIDNQWRDYVMPHDQRIAALTGQAFGENYYEGLLRDTSILLDSAPPIRALLAVAALGGDDLAYLHAMQLGHYHDGKCASDENNLHLLAEKLGIDGAAFAREYAANEEALYQHIVASRALMNQLGAQGFPSVALETSEGHLKLINHSRFYGQPSEWLEYLNEQLS